MTTGSEMPAPGSAPAGPGATPCGPAHFELGLRLEIARNKGEIPSDEPTDPEWAAWAESLLEASEQLRASESARREAEKQARDLRGAMNADDGRLRDASERAFGHFDYGCDTAQWLADEVLGLRQRLASERAAREKAERLLAECDDELENASCPPMTNETIPERIARLAGLVSSTARDEQTALEGKVAAESRLAEAEAVLREIADCQHRYVQTGYASEIHNESECGPCIASAFLAGGKS